MKSTQQSQQAVMALIGLLAWAGLTAAQAQPAVTPPNQAPVTQPSTAGAGRGDAQRYLDQIAKLLTPKPQDQATAPGQTQDQTQSSTSAPGPDDLKPQARITAPPAPKLPPVGTPPSSTQPISVDNAINPLTGRSFSEERLDRLLAANRKVTAIVKEQTEQARLQWELVTLGAGPGQVESARTRSDTINVIKSPQKPVSTEVLVSKSLAKGESLTQQADSSSLSPNVKPAFVPSPMQPEASTAAGTLKIGSEAIDVAYKSGPEPVSTVTYVDKQIRPTVGTQPGVNGGNLIGGNLGSWAYGANPQAYPAAMPTGLAAGSPPGAQSVQVPSVQPLR